MPLTHVSTLGNESKLCKANTPFKQPGWNPFNEMTKIQIKLSLFMNIGEMVTPH